MTRRVTIFLGSYLAFVVQPMVGRVLLPMFGGSSAVWVSCLCVFQTLLVVGYWYAMYCAANGQYQFSKTRISWHCVALTCAALISCGAYFYRGRLLSWLPFDQLGVLMVILCVAGLPYIFLSANSTIVQTVAGFNYRLYVFSNIGSVVGLLSYPLFFEPFVDLNCQWLSFSVVTGIYSVLLLRENSNRSRECEDESIVFSEDVVRDVRGENRIVWFAIPFVTCFLLNALTAHITIDVLPMPFVWVVLLAAYFLSYVVAFTGRCLHFLKLIVAFSSLVIQGVSLVDFFGGREVGFVCAMVVYTVFLFAVCFALNIVLYDVRPDGHLLPRYYFIQVLGGAAGGLLSGLLLPIVSTQVIEYPVAIVASVVAMLMALFRHRISWLLGSGIVVNLLIATFVYVLTIATDARSVVYSGRSVFGIVRVARLAAEMLGRKCVVHEFYDGNVLHGLQVFGIDELNGRATAYYGVNASGAVIVNHPKYRRGFPLRVNITGLGVGTLLTYARKMDCYVAYEISPDVLNVSTNSDYFSYVSDCKADVAVRLCDARLGLEKERLEKNPKYDVIVLDAFSGENLPYHLTTEEAVSLYLDRLNLDGLLCINISNWHLDLEPYVKAVAKRFCLNIVAWKNTCSVSKFDFPSEIAVLSRRPLPDMNLEGVEYVDFSRVEDMEIPQDRRGSFIKYINWFSKR